MRTELLGYGRGITKDEARGYHSVRKHLTQAEARAFQTRWARVNAAERTELRAASLEDKLRQLAALMASVESLGWTEALAKDEDTVRRRWNQLRSALHG
jgi:hypothetical protein